MSLICQPTSEDIKQHNYYYYYYYYTHTHTHTHKYQGKDHHMRFTTQKYDKTLFVKKKNTHTHIHTKKNQQLPLATTLNISTKHH